MTFLNPLLLIGLAAAALPLLIHLLNLRKLRTVNFSSLRFLRELQKTRIRRLRIRQILLLIVRTLLVIFLVLAFSRPAIKGNLAGTIGAQARSTMIILLDDSPSMQIRNRNGVLFNQAKDAAGSVLSLARDNDEVFLLNLSALRQPPESFTPLTPSSALGMLDEMRPANVTVTLHAAAAAITKILSNSANINKEVYVISDGQRSQILSSPTVDSAAHFDPGTRIFFLRPEEPGSRNLGVISVSSPDQLLSAGRPAVVNATVMNGGDENINGSLVSIYLAGERVGQQSVDLTAGNAASLSFTVIPRTAGLLQGSVELEDDALSIDNRRYFVLNIPKTIRIGLVGSRQETQYVNLALSAAGELGARGLFAVDQIDKSALSSADFAQWDVLILCGVSDLSAPEGERLVRFIRGGGGLALFPGEGTVIANANRVLFGPMGVPLAGEPGAESGAFLTFSRIDFAHPLFNGLFEEVQGKKKGHGEVESPRVRRHLGLKPGATGNPLIALSDGTPFLVEYGAGSGRFFVFGVDAALAWSDFPLKGLYAPLIARSAMYLAAGQSREPEVIVGSPAVMKLRALETAEGSFGIRTPDGIRERATQHVNPVTGLTTFVSPPTRELGIYELESGQNPDIPLAAAAVNPDPLESDLRTATPDEITGFFASLGADADHLVFAGPDDDLVRVVEETRYGVELWKFMLMGAIFFALCEMALARVTKGESVEGANT